MTKTVLVWRLPRLRRRLATTMLYAYTPLVPLASVARTVKTDVPIGEKIATDAI